MTKRAEKNRAKMPIKNMDWYKEMRAEMTPSENLMLLRKNRRLTQKALAEKTGIAAADISNMERNRLPICKKSAQKLAAALGTSLGNLFFR